MKNKIFLITILTFFSLFFFLFEAKATEFNYQKEGISIDEKIKILQEEIQRLWSIVLKLQSQKQLEKEIDAHSYLAVNLSNDSILLEKNTKYFYPIASITKLMNAVVVLENVNLEEKITITSEMLDPDGCSPSIFKGLNISAENLLKASLIQSTNDAAESLTYFLGKEKFINLMNQKAQELDMKNTFFCDAHGLSPSNHSTVFDIAKLINYIYKNHSQILEITKNNNFYLPDPSGRMLKFKNLNSFNENGIFVGGKTGYLPEAKQTFASIFTVKENPIAIILLRSINRQSDALKIIDWLNNLAN